MLPNGEIQDKLQCSVYLEIVVARQVCCY